ncbi:MAG: hypothetical protein B7Y71_01725, partial [Xanthobacter sp. 35-67-6]
MKRRGTYAEAPEDSRGEAATSDSLWKSGRTPPCHNALQGGGGRLKVPKAPFPPVHHVRPSRPRLSLFRAHLPRLWLRPLRAPAGGRARV